MKKFLWLILLFSLSGCLETPTGNLPSISKDEIDKEAERQKRISYEKLNYRNKAGLKHTKPDHW